MELQSINEVSRITPKAQIATIWLRSHVLQLGDQVMNLQEWASYTSKLLEEIKVEIYSTPARINCNWWRTRPFDAKMLGSHSSQRIDLRHAPSHFNAKFLSTPKWVALLAIFILWGEQMKGGCLTFEPPSIKPQIKEPFWKANRRAHESEGNGSFDSQLLRPPEESPHRFSTLD